MKGWIVVVLLVISACVFLVGTSSIAYAEEPNLDRCLEYLEPYASVEWERCVGNEFNKFPELGTELKDAYINAPPLGKWPEPQLILPGNNAPMVNFPYSDEAGHVYIAPPDSKSDTPPFVLYEPPQGDYWWDQPTAAQPQVPQNDMYTSWQNYWLSGGATDYGGWAVPGGYTVPPW